MRTRAGSTHIGHRRYAYQSRWYTYRPCPICGTEQVVHISFVSNMCTINVYAYRTRTICIPPALVRILSMSDMRTRAGGTHIGHRQYAYQSRWYAYCPCPICIPPALVCISSVSDMCTTCSGMHIRHGQYAYTFYLYAYCLCLICAPEQVVRISDTDNMHTHLLYAYRTQTICAPEQVVRISSVSDMHTTCSGVHIGHGRYAYK